MTDRRRRGASRSSNCFQTSSAFGFLFFMVRSRKEVDSPDRAGIFDPDGIGIFDRQLTVHRQKKGQRLNTSASPEENAAPKRKRAKLWSSRRFTRESSYQNKNALQALISGDGSV